MRASFILPLTFLVLSCGVNNPLYCDGNTRCEDPLRPYCDEDGALSGVTNNCIESPFDAAQIDADPNPMTPGMVFVPAGPFGMGCAVGDADCQPHELPYHIVTLSAFEIDILEVTNQQYRECVLAGICDALTAPYYDPVNKPDHPARSAGVAMATTYCEWLGKRLPTEAEWEKAARGTDDRMYPWGDVAPTCTIARYGVCSAETMPVGSFPNNASPYGALDMAGNVGEWVGDFYAADYYSQSPTSDPAGPTDGLLRIARGGGIFATTPAELRTSARRESDDNLLQSRWIGFRCAIPVM